MIPKSKTEAIIYIPGLHINDNNTGLLKSTAFRIKNAISAFNNVQNYTYEVEIKNVYSKNSKIEYKVASIFRLDEKKQKQVLFDIYEFDYNKEFDEGRKGIKHILHKILFIFYAVFSKIKDVTITFAKRKTMNSLVKRIQIVWLMFLFSCISIYTIILLSSFIVLIHSKIVSNIPAFHQLIHHSGLQVPAFVKFIYHCLTNNPVYHFFAFGYGLFMVYKKHIICSFAAVLFFLPDFKDIVVNVSTAYTNIVNYINIGNKKLTINGKFEELLEYITKEEVYSSINLYAYSFGSIIALDILFPSHNNVSERLRTKLGSFVTIGCPYEIINLYWPGYFENRSKCIMDLKAWYNVYSDIDILSTKFNTDFHLKVEVSEKTFIEPTNCSFNLIPIKNARLGDVIFLLGFRAHSMYWDEDLSSASCYGSVFDKQRIQYQTTTMEQEQEKQNTNGE